MTKRKTLTTTSGSPYTTNETSRTAGARGPVMLEDHQLIEKLAHQNRERIPERVVHAKGWGLQGTFTVTKDISEYTCAKLFSEVGKQTEVLSRWSTVAGESGAADAERDVRGLLPRSIFELKPSHPARKVIQPWVEAIDAELFPE